MPPRKSVVYLFSFLLAFCSLFYELVFAQILSVCLGGTKTQYLITISLFTSALGIGSLLFNYFKIKMNSYRLFFWIELLLTLLGSAGPFFIAWLLQVETEPSFWTNIKIYSSYFFIFIIGLLSGFELPCLFAQLKEAHGKILAFDYLGMLTASLLFPFYFLPQLGTAASTLFVANINVLALIWLRPVSRHKFTTIFFGLINFITFIVIIFYRTELNASLSSLYLGSR